MVFKGKFLINDNRSTITNLLKGLGFEESKPEEHKDAKCRTTVLENEKYIFIVDDIGDIGSDFVAGYIIEK